VEEGTGTHSGHIVWMNVECSILSLLIFVYILVDMCQKKERTKMLNQQSLLDSGSLPSAWGTRQRLYCTRQSLCRVWHSAKHTRQKIDRQSTLCRVYFIGHSAKALPSAPETLGKEKRPSRRRFRWRSLCRVSTLPALGKDFFKFFLKLSLPSANTWGTRQRAFIFFFENFLCRVPTLHALGKDFFLNSLPSACCVGTRQRVSKKIFAECLEWWPSAKSPQQFFFGFFSPVFLWCYNTLFWTQF